MPEAALTVHIKVVRELSDVIDRTENVVGEKARETISEVMEGLSQAEASKRSADLAYATLTNFLVAAATGVLQAFKPFDIGKEIGKIAVLGGITAIVGGGPGILSFFWANKALLRDFSMAAASDLSWLPMFLSWMEMKWLDFTSEEGRSKTR